tara:strand:- start:285 stop:905 length:621 start_codon:yes stop_codon:yes gene_type:complete
MMIDIIGEHMLPFLMSHILWQASVELESSFADDCQKYLSELDRVESGRLKTSYNRDPSEFPLYPRYEKVFEKILKDLGLYDIVSYNAYLWGQLYDKDSKGHGAHCHFTGSEILSWVHFLKIPEQRCFYFLTSGGNKIYPEHQSQNDMIVFPSWAIHGVDPLENPDEIRVVTAGNITFSSYYGGVCQDLVQTKFENTTLWVNKNEKR